MAKVPPRQPKYEEELWDQNVDSVVRRRHPDSFKPTDVPPHINSLLCKATDSLSSTISRKEFEVQLRGLQGDNLFSVVHREGDRHETSGTSLDVDLPNLMNTVNTAIKLISPLLDLALSWKQLFSVPKIPCWKWGHEKILIDRSFFHKIVTQKGRDTYQVHLIKIHLKCECSVDHYFFFNRSQNQYKLNYEIYELQALDCEAIEKYLEDRRKWLCWDWWKVWLILLLMVLFLHKWYQLR